MDAPDAGTLMTEPVLTVDPSASLSTVATAMGAQRINSIVAIDDDCRPVGILTATDFVAIVGDGADGETVGDHMTEEIVTVAPEASARCRRPDGDARHQSRAGRRGRDGRRHCHCDRPDRVRRRGGRVGGIRSWRTGSAGSIVADIYVYIRYNHHSATLSLKYTYISPTI